MKNTDGRRSWYYIFAAAVIAIGAFAVFGENGLAKVYRLRLERDRIYSDNRVIEAENADLGQKIALLKNDKRYIGLIARKELGMLGRNEVIYKIEDDR